MKSLERAIIGRIVLTLIAIGLVAIGAAYWTARYEADEFMDDYLRQFANATDPAATIAPDHAGFREPEDHFERLIWRNGARIGSTPRAPDAVAQPNDIGFRDFDANGESWRAYVVRRKDFVIMLAQRVGARDELARHAALEVSLVILATMVVVWLIVRWTVGRTMRRLNVLGAEIAARGVDAKEPLPSAALPGEFRPLVDAMNVLIERLQAALEQQRRFIADSAHELRTPLTALRIQIDNLRSAGSAETAAAASALQDGIARAGGVLNQLLRLARFEGQEPPTQPEIVEISEIVTQGVADAIDIADAAGIDIGMTTVERARAKIGRNDLQLLVSNIIDNAIRYTPAGGVVDCDVSRTGRGATIEVKDTGPGVPATTIPHLTERFFRAASIDVPGSGLGLAIVKAIVDSYGLTLAIRNRTDRSGLIVSVSFPLGALMPDEPARRQLIDSKA